MAIQYVGGVTGGRAGATPTTTQSLSTTLTGGIATSPAAGDLVLVYCSVGWDTTAATSQTISGNNSGAYSNATFQSTDDTYDSGSQFNYQKMGATPDTSITIPSSASARNAQRWVVHVFRNVDGTTPLDVTVQPASGINTGRPAPAAITPSTAGAWVVAFYSSAALTGTAYTSPGLTGWIGNTTVDTVDCMNGAGYYTGWASGPYTPPAITAGGTTNAADSWTAMTVALRPMIHPSSGALAGPGSTVAGTAAHVARHATTGVLAGQGSTIVGSASSKTTRPSTGVLTGQGSAVVGSAARTRAHATSGVLAGQGSTVVGSASSATTRASSGALAGQGSVVVGAANREAGGVTHATSGVLAGQGAVVAGSADSGTTRTATGGLVGQGSAVEGSAARLRVMAADGVLVGPNSILAGEATRTSPPVNVAATDDGGGGSYHQPQRSDKPLSLSKDDAEICLILAALVEEGIL